MPVAAEYFIGTVDNELVCHIAVAPFFHMGYYRGTRLVTMPEWQGAGVGTKFLNWVAEYHKRGYGRNGKKLPVIFHTSHPQLIGYLNHSKQWVLKSQKVFGSSREKSKKSLGNSGQYSTAGFGGHFRAIRGFKYIGDGKPPKKGMDF